MYTCIFPIIDKSCVNQHNIVLLTGSLGLPSVASDRLGGGHAVGPMVVLGGRGFVSVQEKVRGAGRRCQVVGGWVSRAVPWVPDCTSCTERERWFNILLFNKTQAYKKHKIVQFICLSSKEGERKNCFNNLFQTKHWNISNNKMFIEERCKITDFIDSTMDHQFVYQNLLTSKWTLYADEEICNMDANAYK